MGLHESQIPIKRYLLRGKRHDCSSSPGVVETVGMASEGAQLRASGLSTKVFETILHSRAPSTGKLYSLKWKLFTSWCGDCQLDPVNFSAGSVLQFLQELFSSYQHFFCFSLPKGGLPATKQTLSRWIVEAISPAYESSVLPSPLGVRAQSTKVWWRLKPSYLVFPYTIFVRLQIGLPCSPLTHMASDVKGDKCTVIISQVVWHKNVKIRFMSNPCRNLDFFSHRVNKLIFAT